MSSTIDFSIILREQSTTETVTTTFEPFKQRRTRTFYSRCFGLCEVFVEWNGVIVEWAHERNSDGFTIWMGRLSITYNSTYEQVGECDGEVRTRDQWDDEGSDSS